MRKFLAKGGAGFKRPNLAVPVRRRGERSESIACTLCAIAFVFALGNSIFALTRGWHNPILDPCSFRETQTAISAYYISQGGPLLAYETPVLGAPWSIPFEFPLYQWIVSALYKVLGMRLDAAGRVVSIFFYYLTLWPLWSLLGTFQIKKTYRLMLLTLFLTAPSYLFWPREFLIESTALFFSIAYLACVIRYAKLPRAITFIGATLCGLIAALVKITTFFVFPFLSGVIFASILFTGHFKSKLSLPTKEQWLVFLILPLLGFALLPYVAIDLWVSFSDAQKAAVPLGKMFVSSELHCWNFGTLRQRLSGELWKGVVFERHGNDFLGTGWMVIASLIIAVSSRKYALAALLCVLSYVALILTFTNLFLRHTYYEYECGIFLVTLCGFSILSLLSRKGVAQYFGLALFFLTLGLQVREYYTGDFYASTRSISGPPITALAKEIDKQSRPTDIVLIYGMGFDSALPYYAQRRAIMDPRNLSFPLSSPIMRETFAKSLQGNAVLAVVAFCKPISDKINVLDRLRTLQFEEKPYFSDALCDLYKPKSGQERKIS